MPALHFHPGGPAVIYILEDNPDRIRQFVATAAVVAPDRPVRVWPRRHFEG